MQLNLQFLLRHYTIGGPGAWIQEEVPVDKDQREAFVRQIQEFLAGCPIGTLLIKAGGLPPLIEFWLNAAHRECFSVKVIIVVRYPQEVFASTKAAFGDISLESLSTRWLETYLHVEHHSRDLPRAVVEYKNLLNDWRGEVARLSKALRIDLQINEAAIDDFLDRDLHRQRSSEPIKEIFGYRWLSRIYEALSVAAQDEPMNLATFDEIYSSYSANVRTLRIALDEYRRGSAESQNILEKLKWWPTWELGRDY
jgi:hypothetical protein